MCESDGDEAAVMVSRCALLCFRLLEQTERGEPEPGHTEHLSHL